MSCPKNILQKRFLFWKYETEGEHDMEILSVGKFMDCSQDFEVTRKCSICGTVKTEGFVETEELLREGLSIDELNTITGCNFFLP